MIKKLLSIQDLSCYGKCSQMILIPVVSSLGIEVSIIPTMLLSTHTGFLSNTSISLMEEDKKILNHFKNLKINFDGILVSYLGSIGHIKWLCNDLKDYQDSLIVIDPVMGDNHKLYRQINFDYVEEMKRLITISDVITPNYTELLLLADQDINLEYSHEVVVNCINILKSRKVKKIICTGCEDNNTIKTYICDDSIEVFENEKIANSLHGTGDLFSSFFISNLLKGLELKDATISAINEVIKVIKLSNLDKESKSLNIEEYLFNKINK